MRSRVRPFAIGPLPRSAAGSVCAALLIGLAGGCRRSESAIPDAGTSDGARSLPAFCQTYSGADAGEPDAGSADGGQDAGPMSSAEFFQAARRLESLGGTCGPGLKVGPALQVDDLEKAVAGGRLLFDGARARTCANAFASLDPATCWGPSPPATLAALESALRDGTGPCAGVLRPATQLGQTCYLSAECVDAFCLGCPGSCTPFQQSGESCSTYPCAPGLECRPVAGFICEPPPNFPEGHDCTSALEDCAPGLYCDATTTPSFCRARLSQGSSCNAS